MLERRRCLTLFLSVAAVATTLSARPLHAVEQLSYKLFDTHTHFVTPDFSRYPLTPPPVLPGVPPNPASAGLPDRIKSNPTNAERVFELWDANGVGAGVGVQYRTAYNTNNTYLIDVATQHPRRVVPIALLDALDPNTSYILRSMVRDAGVAGVRFSGSADSRSGEYLWLTSAAAQQTWQAANDLHAVIVLMPLPATVADPKVLQTIADNAGKYPNVRIVLDHFGWLGPIAAPDHGLTGAHAALKARRNIYYKFSSIVIEQMMAARVPVADFLRHAVDVYGADHIMWGSDLGNSSEPYAEMVKLAIEATARLTPAERKWVLRDTGIAVHGAGGRRRH